MMLGVEWIALATFVPAGLALNLTPGADMMFCLGQGIRSGPVAAMAANFGIAVGGMIHTLAAGLGLGALLAAHPLAFDVIRWGGVGYLLFLAVQGVRASGPLGGIVAKGLRPAQAFRQALMVNLLNPKVILFILAFLPQFIDPNRAVLPQFLFLGTVFCCGGLVVNGVVGVFAGKVGQRLAQSDRFSKALGRISAGVYAALALRLAMLEH